MDRNFDDFGIDRDTHFGGFHAAVAYRVGQALLQKTVNAEFFCIAQVLWLRAKECDVYVDA